jgi:hypothetical protein
MRGLSKKMLQRLLLNIGNRYEILFATASKLNPKLTAHLKSGWKIIKETDDLFLICYITSK